MPNFKFIWPALHDFSQTNPKSTPVIWLFWQRNIFGTKFGSFCIIQKRFDHNWIKNGHAVWFYFWALFANLNFLNFIAWSIVQWWYGFCKANPCQPFSVWISELFFSRARHTSFHFHWQLQTEANFWNTGIHLKFHFHFSEIIQMSSVYTEP